MIKAFDALSKKNANDAAMKDIDPKLYLNEDTRPLLEQNQLYK